MNKIPCRIRILTIFPPKTLIFYFHDHTSPHYQKKNSSNIHMQTNHACDLYKHESSNFCGGHCSVGAWIANKLSDVRFVVRILTEQDMFCSRTRPDLLWGPPSLLFNGYRRYSRGYSGRCVTTTRFHLTLLPLITSWLEQG